jgi:hypothetical protein
VEYDVISKNRIHVSVTWILKDSLQQDDVQVTVLPAFNPVFNWAPHLTPTDNHIIAQHVFRSPELIVTSSQKQLILVPDLDILQDKPPVNWYMDMNAAENKLTLGLSGSRVKEHVLYVSKQ